MFELKFTDDLVNFEDTEFTLKDIEEKPFILATNLWLYYIQNQKVYRAGFTYEKSGVRIHCQKLIEVQEVEEIPGWIKKSEALVEVSEETKKSVCEIYGRLVKRVAEKKLDPVLFFADAKHKKEAALIYQNEHGLWEVKKPKVAQTAFRTELAAVIFGTGLGLMMADEMDAIPEGVQKKVFEQFEKADALRVLSMVSWIDQLPPQGPQDPQSAVPAEKKEIDRNIQTEEKIAQEITLPGYFR